MPTASALDRAAVCPASEALPAARRTSEYAEHGIEGHAFLVNVQKVGRDEALALAPDEYRDAFAMIDVDELPVDGSYAPEVSLAYDLMTGQARELGRDTDRDYSDAHPTEVCGTSDVVGIFAGGVYVGDFKFGWRVPNARQSRQLKLYALAALKVYGGDRAVVEIIRVRKGGGSYYDRAVWDRFDLEVDFHSELEQIASRVSSAHGVIATGRVPNVVEGEHCRYCPAAHACPARMALVGQLAEPRALGTTADVLGFELTGEHAAAARRRVAVIEAMLAEVKRQIDAYAWSHPIPLGPADDTGDVGLFYGQVQKRGKAQLDAEATYAMLADEYGEDIADRAAPAVRTATQKGIDEALRELKDRRLIRAMAPVKRALLKNLEDTGALTRKPTTSLREYKAPICRTDECYEQAMVAGGTCRLCAIDAELGEGAIA